MPATYTPQAYSGNGRSSNKVYYRIQPYLPNGDRVTIRLGTGKKKANTSSKMIGDLIDSQSAGQEPAAATKKWVEKTASKTLCRALIKHGLIARMPARFEKTKATTISMLADEYIRTRCAGLDSATVTVVSKAKRNLIDCFGDVGIKSLAKKDGREFYRWLLDKEKGEGLAENTAKQRLRYARAYYEMAIEDELVSVNPFKARGLSVAQTAAEKEYVEKAWIKKVIKACPTPEWAMLFQLCRNVPIRMPSEIQDFTWDDINWDKNQMLIHSPKTRKLGRSARLVPIFDELKQPLQKLCESQAKDEEFVFPTLRRNSNPGTTAKRIVRDAEIKPWKNFFNSLRASAETDLMDQYGLRKACMWAGNSAATAMKNYALVKKTDFDDAGTGENSVALRATGLTQLQNPRVLAPCSSPIPPATIWAKIFKLLSQFRYA